MHRESGWGGGGGGEVGSDKVTSTVTDEISDRNVLFHSYQYQ